MAQLMDVQDARQSKESIDYPQQQLVVSLGGADGATNSFGLGWIEVSV